MSWFAKSLATTLNLNDDDDDDSSSSSTQPNPTTESPTHPNSDPTDSPSNRGVKEDLSELTKTLTRNFWGVASFLAPPPPSSSDSDPTGSDPDDSDPNVIPNIRNDFAEIGGKFRSGISKISNNMAVVSEITTKLASNFLQLGAEDEGGRDYYEFGAVGVTDRVVDFVRDVVMHPETWLDFPLPDNDDQDFDMSDAQQEHALAVEQLVPRLAALRMELCPGYMSEACFWKIYFVLLHPRLDQHDAEVLSTPQIVKARSLLTLNNLRNNTSAKPEQDSSNRDAPSIEEDMKSPAEEFLSAPSATQIKSVPVETSALESAPLEADIETEKHPVSVNEVQIVDKSVIQEENMVQNKKQNLPSISSSNVLGETDEDDADDWLKEETSETVSSSDKIIPIDNDEDVSFSDLEDEGDDVPTSSKKKESRDWVQLDGSKQKHEPENKDSSDWLDLDDIEVE